MNAFKEAVYLTILVVILGLMGFIVFHVSDVVESLARVERDLSSPKIARTSVMHGYFVDQQNPKNSGLRMIRVARDGTLLVMPLMPPKPPEKAEVPKDAPSK